MDSSAPTAPAPAETYQAPPVPRWARGRIELLLTAVMFYTRLPCPAWVGHDPVLLNRATRFFPLVGWGVALISGVALVVGTLLLPLPMEDTAVRWRALEGPWFELPMPPLAALLALVAGVLTTGAFHEDGLADVADGMGGGWTRPRILEIMRDSRMGAYGAVALVLCLIGQWQALALMPNLGHGLMALWVAHGASRGLAVIVIARMPYAQDIEGQAAGKAKPVAAGLSGWDATWGLLGGAAPLLLYSSNLLFPGPAGVLPAVVISLAFVYVLLTRWYRRWLGGYTGDCLGALQQIAFVVTLIALAAAHAWPVGWLAAHLPL